jgi:hypothetical protein
MNLKLKSFNRQTSLCLEGYILQLKSNLWCKEYTTDGVQSFKISYAHLESGVISLFTFNIKLHLSYKI